ncbi:hypothetical protein AB4Z39_23905 [Mycobacterium adipatum]|jgi:hypothetical protein|uniref:hypothetical protein n=1 Tax=Mycobacterium adipatum TaxID=1682113 RepID=UPI0034E0A596
MTTTYVASVSPFTTVASDDSSPVARVRYVNDSAIYVKVADIRHEALPSVTGYPVDFWLRIDQLARQAHRYLAELIAARKIAQVTTFEELPATVVARIHDSSEVARLGPIEMTYLQLRITDLLRFG